MNQKTKTDTSPATTQSRTARTRKALCDGLLSLLEEKSFDQIIVREITARAGVGYATFFRRYEDKDALLHDVAAQEIHKLLTMALPILYSVDTEASTKALCAYVWKHRKIWKTLLTGGAAATLKEEYLIQALELAKGHSGPEAWLPDDLAVTFAVTAIVEILTWWLKQDSPIAAKELAIYLNKLAIVPLFEQ